MSNIFPNQRAMFLAISLLMPHFVVAQLPPLDTKAYITRAIDVPPSEEHAIAGLYDQFLNLLAGGRMEPGTKLPATRNCSTETMTTVIFHRSYYISPNELRGFEISIPKTLLEKQDDNYVVADELEVEKVTEGQGIKIAVMKKLVDHGKPHSYTNQIRRLVPHGWQVSSSNNVIVLRRKNPVWIMGKISNPPIMPDETVAAYFQRCGRQTHYELRLRFVPLLSQQEFEKLQAARREAAYRLKHDAHGKIEYTKFQIQLEKCQVPEFFTKHDSIFVEHWADVTNNVNTSGYHLEPGFIEIYPPEAATEVESIEKNLGKVFQKCGSQPKKGAEQAEEYRSFASPDGRFKLVVYRTPLPVAMPGQSGDAPGFVRLYDLRTGKILKQKDVQMVQLIDQFEWSPTNLYIKLFADWKLPP